MSSKRRTSHSKKQKRGILFYIFPIVSLAIAAYCIIYIVQWFSENGANKEVMESILSDTVAIDEGTGETKIDFAKLKEKNRRYSRLA